MPFDDGAQLSAPSPALACWLRARVLRLRRSMPTRHFPVTLEVVPAVPSQPQLRPPASRYDVGRADDHALRVDLLLRLLDDAADCGVDSSAAVAEDGTGPGAAVALVCVRPGPVEVGDSDLAWWAALRCVRGIAAGDPERLVAVTRWGWLDVGSGTRKTWRRLRR